MTVDTMTIVLWCLVILRDMCIEEQINDGEESPEDIAESTNSVGRAEVPMWGRLRWLSNSSTDPAAGSFATLCEVQRFTKDQSELTKTKKLLASHVWCSYSDRWQRNYLSVSSSLLLDDTSLPCLPTLLILPSFVSLFVSLRRLILLLLDLLWDMCFRSFSSASSCINRKYSFAMLE